MKHLTMDLIWKSLFPRHRRVELVGIFGLLLAGTCWLKDAREQFALRRFTMHLVDPTAPREVQIQRLTHWVHESALTPRNPGYFLLPSLRATPAQILRDGGDCADRARLLVAMLAAMRIPATSVMLFDVNTHRPCHTVVEAEYARGRRMVVDPTFGLCFPAGDGGFLSLTDLRTYPESADLEILRRQSLSPWPSRICFYRRDMFTYAGASSIHWNGNSVARLLHAMLHPLLGEKIYHLRRTAWLERPAMTCAAILAALSMVTWGLLALFRARRRRYDRTSTRVIRLVRSDDRTPVFASTTRRLAAVLALAALIRLAWWAIAQPQPTSDFQHYYALTCDLLDHGQLGWPEPTAYRLPLYPALLAGLMTISRSIPWMSLCNVMLSVGLVSAVYMLAKRLIGNANSALLAAGCCALNVSFILFSPVLASEHLFALLIVLGWLALSAQDRRAGLRLTGAGVCLGLACLTRGEGIFWAPVYLYAAWRRGGGGRTSLMHAASVATIAIVIVLPWIARNQRLFGPGVGLSSAGGINFYLAHRPEGYGWQELDQTSLGGLNTTQAHRRGFTLGREHLLSEPFSALSSIAKGTLQLYRPSNYGLFWSTGWSPDKSAEMSDAFLHAAGWLLSIAGVAAYLTLVGLCLIGLVLMNGLLRETRREWLLAVGMNWMCYAVVFWATGRYRFLVEVLMCVPAGVALAAIRRAWSARTQQLALRTGLLTAPSAVR